MGDRYWMAQTDFPAMWAIGEGDTEVAHVHDRALAIKIKDLLNAAEPKIEPAPDWPKAWIYDRPSLPDASRRFKVSIDDGVTMSGITSYHASWDAAMRIAKQYGVHENNIVGRTNVY